MRWPGTLFEDGTTSIRGRSTDCTRWIGDSKGKLHMYWAFLQKVEVGGNAAVRRGEDLQRLGDRHGAVRRDVYGSTCVYAAYREHHNGWGCLGKVG